jgi:hypothetical protein
MEPENFSEGWFKAQDEPESTRSFQVTEKCRGYQKLINKLKSFNDTEIEKHFELTLVRNSGSAEYYCKLCKVPNINYSTIKYHIDSRRHQQFVNAEDVKSQGGVPGYNYPKHKQLPGIVF